MRQPRSGQTESHAIGILRDCVRPRLQHVQRIRAEIIVLRTGEHPDDGTAVRKRHDMVMHEHDAMPRFAPRLPLREREQPLELRRTNCAVLSIEAPLPARLTHRAARVYPHRANEP